MSYNKPRTGEKKKRWSIKYKKSINCSDPKGFSQINYCKRKKRGGKYKTESFVSLLVQSISEEQNNAYDNIAVRVSDYHWKDRASNKVPSGYYPGVYFYTGPGAEEKVKSNFKQGKNVYKLDITGAKLYNIESPEKAKKLKDEAEKASKESGYSFPVTQGSGHGDVEYLKSKGYDGIRRGIEVIIFEPQKFKEI